MNKPAGECAIKSEELLFQQELHIQGSGVASRYETRNSRPKKHRNWLIKISN